MKAATQEEAKAVTSVFWDIKRYPVPPGFDARRVRPCIKQLLEKYGYNGPLTICAVGILTDVHSDILEALYSSGISICYAPCDALSILYQMLEWMDNNPAPANILGICNPIAFPGPNRTGYNLLQAFPYSSSSKEDADAWINSILAESETLEEEDTCSETDESAIWSCLMCYCLGGKGFESYTMHLASDDHEEMRLLSLPVEDFVTMNKFENEDENPPTIVRKQPKEPTSEEAMALTSVFWDMKRFPIPPGFNPFLVSLCIKRFLEKYGYSGPITVHAVGILTDLARDIRRALSVTGIILHGSIDIRRLMSRWISENQSPVNILGICDPRSFPLPLSGYIHNIFRPFPYTSPREDRKLWENTLLAGVLEEDMCSETDEPASWFCLICNNFHGEGFKILTQLQEHELEVAHKQCKHHSDDQ